MATPGKLIKVVADVLGIPEATATTYYRSLREAGLVTKSGRGPSAAKMTVRDAVQLLIAAGGSRAEKDTAEKIVRDFDRVQADHSWRRMARPVPGGEPGWLDGDGTEGDGAWVLDGFSIPQLQSLPARHSLADALTALIEAVMADAIVPAHSALSSYGIIVSLYGPEPHAGIEIDLHGGGNFSYREEVGYQLAEQIDKHPGNHAEIEQSVRRAYGNGDLKITRQFTHRTIYEIARLMLGLDPLSREINP
jgi:hypothetical protein